MYSTTQIIQIFLFYSITRLWTCHVSAFFLTSLWICILTCLHYYCTWRRHDFFFIFVVFYTFPLFSSHRYFTYLHTCIHEDTHTCTHEHKHTCIHEHTHTCTHVRLAHTRWRVKDQTQGRGMVAGGGEPFLSTLRCFAEFCSYLQCLAVSCKTTAPQF